MELLELTQKVKKLFEIENISDLGDALMRSMDDNQKKDAFLVIVNHDLTIDWLQMIYQYYKADRKEKKQDYTPASLAKLCSRLIGESEEVIDMCAGSGALSIQYWRDNPQTKMVLYEIDAEVIPFLLFNLSIRNIYAEVIQCDVLTQKINTTYVCRKGEKYGKVTII